MMATHENTTTGAEEERPCCPMGSKSANPCARPGVVRVWQDSPDRLYCVEHADAIRHTYEREEMTTALYLLQEWIAGTVAQGTNDDLERYALGLRDRMEEDLWALAVAERVAGLLADPPPGQKPPTREQAERLAPLLLRADALSGARAILEGLPEEAFGGSERWPTIAALKLMSEEANAEVQRYKRGIGLTEREEAASDAR